MKRLYLNIILFLIPVFLLIAAIPLDNRLQYEGLKNDCFYHGLWFYDRLFDNKKPVDIAFLGSSQTMGGVNDSIVEKALSETKLKVANFGYCRLGMNFDYIILKEILKTKKPKIIIIEVREDENRYSHPVFPFLGKSPDVLLANPLFNKDLIGDMYNHLAFKIEIFQEMAFKKREIFYPSAEEFGYCPTDDTASKESLLAEKQKLQLIKPELTTLERNFHMKYPRVYLEKINTICKEEKIKIYFLFMPVYGLPEALLKPKEYNFIIKYGEVLIPPKAIFTKTDNWFDPKHLNVAGASELSEWIGKELNKIIETKEK